MADFNSMRFGTSPAGVTSLIDGTYDSVKELINEVSNINEIKTACDSNWEGTSKDKFLECLAKDVELLKQNLESIYNAFNGELAAISTAMIRFDENLMMDQE